MQEQLESVVLQIYKEGMRCSEAVRAFQKAFIHTCSRIREEISARRPGNSAYTGIRCAVRFESWRLTSAPHEQWGNGGQRDQRFQWRRCGGRSNTSDTPKVTSSISGARILLGRCRRGQPTG
jgi:hypothetical protein